ncbi:Uncharacterised protein [Bordetella pertussis]|nr:Uncharacterised protein [Bordetella pertussis]CFP67632.1 Uncharacterised protein [Bordetella pertussis]
MAPTPRRSCRAKAKWPHSRGNAAIFHELRHRGASPHTSYCNAISTSTPAGRSRRISASTVLSVGSTMSIRR